MEVSNHEWSSRIGIRRRMLNCLNDFMANRSFEVHLGSVLSEKLCTEE